MSKVETKSSAAPATPARGEKEGPICIGFDKGKVDASNKLYIVR